MRRLVDETQAKKTDEELESMPAPEPFKMPSRARCNGLPPIYSAYTGDWPATKSDSMPIVSIANSLSTEIWQRSREELKVMLSNLYNYQAAVNLDSNWFSKLESIEDHVNKTIRLKARTSCVQGWVQSNYEREIRNIISKKGYELIDIFYDDPYYQKMY